MMRYFLVLITVIQAWAVGAYRFSDRPMKVLKGDEEIKASHYPSGPGFSPGDSVDYTRYDYQRNGQTGWQVWHDSAGGTHVDLMSAHQSGAPDRCCAYNYKIGGNWTGRIQVSSARAGYVALGVKPSNNAAVCCYHMCKSGDIYRSWVAILDSLGGEKPILPQITDIELIWPRFAIDDQDNFHAVVHGYFTGRSYYTRSTDDGDTWSDTLPVNPDTSNAFTISTGVFADRLNTPGRIIVYWTQWTNEGSGGVAQHAQDVWYMISTDYGVTWGPKINLTHYQPSDTMRAFCQVKGIFDRDGEPHLVFPTHYFDGTNYYARSWIIHWSPNTGFSVVVGPIGMTNNPGGWRLPSDFPNITLDRDNGYLHCTYVLNRDSDMSAGGFPNGDIFWKGSMDNGKTWISNAPGDTGVNLTRTPTPGCPPGQCCDDDYPSMHPYIETINGYYNLIMSYVEDKDAGGIPQGEGTETNNPYRVYFIPSQPSVAEGIGRSVNQSFDIRPNPSKGKITIRFSSIKKEMVRISILDPMGRLVAGPIKKQTCCRRAVTINRHLPPGLYFIRLETEGHTEVKKVVIIE